jgi:CHASE3 domain sensor protein
VGVQPVTDDAQQNHRDLVSLRDYFNEKIKSLEERLDQQRQYMERAVDKAEVALGRRLDGMNEFRDALKDQSARMATQEQLDRVRDRVIEVEKRAAVQAGIWSMIVSIVVGLAIRWLVK